MKSILFLIAFCCLTFYTVLGQEVSNELSKNNQEWLDKDWPVTDTLQYNLPNEGKLLILFNDQDYTLEELEESLSPLVKTATKFPDFETVVYRVASNFYPTSLNAVKNKIDRTYVRHIESIELGIPMGLDFTAGYFTPEVGFRAHLSMPGYSLGASITNTVYFPEREEGKIEVNSNWFINAEFSWNKGRAVVNNDQTIQVGYLLNQGSYNLFKGTTLRAIYRHRISNHLYIQAGVVGTEDMSKIYPVIGIRFW